MLKTLTALLLLATATSPLAQAKDLTAPEFFKDMVATIDPSTGVYEGQLAVLGGNCALSVSRNKQTNEVKLTLSTDKTDFVVYFAGNSTIHLTEAANGDKVYFDDNGSKAVVPWSQGTPAVSIGNSHTQLMCLRSE